jgi:hypothetical protein
MMRLDDGSVLQSVASANVQAALMGNHIIFLHQYVTIGESDRQFVIM